VVDRRILRVVVLGGGEIVGGGRVVATSLAGPIRSVDEPIANVGVVGVNAADVGVVCVHLNGFPPYPTGLVLQQDVVFGVGASP